MNKERELLKRVRDTLLGLKETHYDLYWDIQTALDLREELREDLREEVSLRDATNDGLRKEIASLRTANDRQEADLRLAKTALAETMKLFNNQPNDSGLRDHFAGLAMQGTLSADTEGEWNVYSYLANHAYQIADAMLAERGKEHDH